MFFCQIDEPNGFGNTPLHVACYMGQEAVATELVNHGANVNQPNKCGYTPLHLAAVSTNGALCLELLVNNGADVNQQVRNTTQCQSEKCSVVIRQVSDHFYIQVLSTTIPKTDHAEVNVNRVKIKIVVLVGICHL